MQFEKRYDRIINRKQPLISKEKVLVIGDKNESGQFEAVCFCSCNGNFGFSRCKSGLLESWLFRALAKCWSCIPHRSILLSQYISSLHADRLLSAYALGYFNPYFYNPQYELDLAAATHSYQKSLANFTGKYRYPYLYDPQFELDLAAATHAYQKSLDNYYNKYY